MKVILVNPYITSLKGVRLPLSLLALGSVLEGRYEYVIVDGNIDPQAENTVIEILQGETTALLACTVMPGPQVGPAIAISAKVRAMFPRVPIIWGGYFPTLYPDSALNAAYVDYVGRGQGEDLLIELLEHLPSAGPPVGNPDGTNSSATDTSALKDIKGLSFKYQGSIIHNPDRPFVAPDKYPQYPYHSLRDINVYLRPSFMGSRTGVHQAAIGCRFRCSFCGVVSMFNGVTRYPAAERLELTLNTLRGYGANAMQYYDHNFFDREENTLPLLEVMAKHPLPWWCYARADALANAPERTWKLIRASGLRMAYIGAEAADDEALRRMKKGTRVEHTFAVAAMCRENGIIPEFSFVLGGPGIEDPEEDLVKNFNFIRKLKKVYPECEIILYFYTPTPQRDRKHVMSGGAIPRLPGSGMVQSELPQSPEEWTEQRWVDFVCHMDAPWLTPGLKEQVRDFSRVLYCRFPTVQDHSTPAWGKAVLKGLASWRYATHFYRYGWELEFVRRRLKLRNPQSEGL